MPEHMLRHGKNGSVLKKGKKMKLILKDRQEIQISSMNNSYSTTGFKDGKGNALNYDRVITLLASQNESFDSIKAKLSTENCIDFILSYGKTRRDFTGWRIERVTEELSDEHNAIAIRLEKI